MNHFTAIAEKPSSVRPVAARLAGVSAPPKADLFGVGTSKAGADEVLATIMDWAKTGRPATVDFMSVHGLALSHRDPEFRRRLNTFDIVACDGQPVRWALNRWHDARLAQRVYGPAMTLAVCRAAAEQGVGVYFYGARPDVLEKLLARMREQFPKLAIVGAESPPFRTLTAAEMEETAARINSSGAGIVFIGMGCPKQEMFATDQAGKINAVQLCVGAAFDFHAGTLAMAPEWMQRSGLEWFYRLCREPRRLWKRYLTANSTFIALWARQWLRAAPSATAHQFSERRDHCRNAVATAPRIGSPLTGLSVIVPLFNERDCAAMLVASLLELQQSLGNRYDFEFVLVDDGSSDETVPLLEQAVAGRANFRLVKHETNRGIGAAIQTGLRAARHEIAATIDCDGSYDPLLLAEMAPKLTDGVDLVTASPYHPDGSVDNIPRWRLRLSRLASQMYSVVCRRKLTCYTSCYRVYRRSAVAPLTVANEGFVGVAELLWRLLEQGGEVVEHPARLRARVAGQSKMRIVRAGLGHLRLMGAMLAVRLGSKFSRRQASAAPASVNHSVESTSPSQTS
jgi:exopolysaccharide biosynthesis WecB/TagA/CpsF family protein